VSALEVAVFDVNETLVDLEPLRDRFEQVGAPGAMLETWFSGTLRDGFALTAAGAYADFNVIATEVLRIMLSRIEGVDQHPAEAAEHVVAGFGELSLHADVAPGMRALRAAGIRLVTLTNGSAELTGRLLERGGVAELVERRLSVDAVRHWKPAPEPYLYAARECGAAAETTALIAVHPWDVDGAKRAGLRGGWINRKGDLYPPFFTSPDAQGADLPALVDALL
jgi:2-haloacid dehalogenase